MNMYKKTTKPSYDNTIKHLRYRNFCLNVGQYYIIEILKAKVDTDEDKTPFKGIAQLTRIDFINGEYYVIHFKHNKAEYLQYFGSRHSSNTCVCVQPQIAEFGFSFNNSRIRIDDNGNEYYPENYKPGEHIK